MKKSTKTFFIIPGFKEQASAHQYQWLVTFIKSKGWKTVEVPVAWNNQTLSQNADEFRDFYSQHKSVRNQILGFSYGAVIALLSAESLGPEHIYLCSLSPDFKEDVASMPPWIKKYIGKKRYDDVLTRGAQKIAKNLSVPATIFYGEVEGCEYPNLKTRCEETAQLAKRARLITIPEAPHQINFPTYQVAIIKELSLK